MSGVSPRWPRAETICLAAFLLGTASICICSISRRIPWLPHYDDANYVVTAKALATGEGYRLISFPDAPPQTLYPPFYPIVLSAIWRLEPEFPANLKSMLLVSTAAALGFLLLTYGYLTRCGHAGPGFALAIIFFTSLNPLTLFYATSVMSETLYAALTIAGLWLIEAWGKRPGGGAASGTEWRHGVATGLVLGASFLTRTVGVALIGTAIVDLIRKRQWKRLALLSAVACTFATAWFVWSYIADIHIRRDSILARPSRMGFILEGLGHGKLDFLRTITQNLFTVAVSLGCTLIAFFIHVGADVRTTSVRMAFAALVFALVLLVLGFIRSLRGGFRPVHWFVVLYLAAITIPPIPPQQRYLLPLVPFLLLWSGSELDRMSRLFIGELRAMKTVMNVMIASTLCVCIALWGAYVTYRHVYWTRILIADVPASYRVQWLENNNVLHWIAENTDPRDVLVCEFDPLYYLFTGRRAAPIHGATQIERAAYRWLPQWKPEDTLEMIKKSHARYLILGPTSVFTEWGRRAVQSGPGAFSLVYTSPDAKFVIYQINRERL